MLRRKQQQQKGHCQEQAEEHPTEVYFVSLCTQKIFGLSGIDQNLPKRGESKSPELSYPFSMKFSEQLPFCSEEVALQSFY